MSMPSFEEIEGEKKGLILKGLNFQGFQIWHGVSRQGLRIVEGLQVEMRLGGDSWFHNPFPLLGNVPQT
jgi:hypothetical protein